MHEVFDTGVEDGSNAGEVAGQLPRPPGLPLCDGAAGHADVPGKLVLCQPAMAPLIPQAMADVGGVIHDS